MLKPDSQMKVMRLNEPGGEMLDAKYFCKVDNCQKIDVVINLKANENIPKSSKVCQRYVIVMDVSGSMNEMVKGDNRSLLERIKIFGNLFIENLSPDVAVSIVTFSNYGEIVLPMTKMDSEGKVKAKNAIENLKTVAMTNISDGLFKALEAIHCCQSTPSRDCIILFTDGQANDGITDAKTLVREYKYRVESMGRANAIPVSSITIGGNQPFFLNQVSAELGSDSFYWLNETSNFEVDMLLPMVLRELPSIVDVKVEVTCQNDVVFLEEDSAQPYLQKKDGNTSRIYFIHMIPSAMEKNLYLTLKIPEKSKEEIEGKIILEVWKTFLDNDLQQHRSTDFLELKLTSMREALYQAYKIPESQIDSLNSLEKLKFGPEALDYLENTSSYTNVKNETRFSWKDAQESIVNVLGQKCRLDTASALEQSAKFVDHGLSNEAKDTCKNALSKLEKVERLTENILGKNNPHCATLHENVKKNFQDKLESLTEDIDNVQAGRLTAMASSFSTEMPTARGVFGENSKQPFMPAIVDETVKKILRKLKGEEEVEPLDSYRKIVYIFKAVPNLDEEYDADALFLSSILPDLQKLNEKKRFEMKLEMLKLLHAALYD